MSGVDQFVAAGRGCALDLPSIHPKKLDQQSPKVITEVCAAAQVSLYVTPDGFETKEIAIGGFGGRECIEKEFTERAAQPVVGRKIQAELWTPHDERRQFVLHQLLQDYFLTGALDFEVCGKGSRELDNAVIEKRRSNLDRVGAMLIRSTFIKMSSGRKKV